MVNSKALRQLETIRRAIISLGIEGQEVVRFVQRELPVIEVKPGYTQGTTEGNYNYTDAKGCRIIWLINEEKKG